MRISSASRPQTDRGAVSAPHLSLTDLPDELLDTILATVNRNTAGERMCCGSARDLLHVALSCKRFARLARQPSSALCRELLVDRLAACQGSEAVNLLLARPELTAALAEINLLSHPGMLCQEDSTENIVPALRARCGGLRTLGLGDTHVSEAGCAALATLTGLQSLELELTQLTAPGLSHLTSLSRLTHLGMAATNMRELGADVWCAFPSMRSLNLQSTGLTPAALAGVTAMRGLRQLNVAYNDFDDSALQPLRSLTQLSRLKLCGNRLTDESLGMLQSLRGLRHIWIGDTQISGRDAPELRHIWQVHLSYFDS